MSHVNFTIIGATLWFHVMLFLTHCVLFSMLTAGETASDVTLQVMAGETVGQVTATDADVGSNAQVIFGIERDSETDGELFTVDPESGLLSANVNLRPGINGTSTSYSLIVTASNPSREGHAQQTRAVVRLVIDRPTSPMFGSRGRQAFVFTGHSMVAIATVGAVSALVIVILLIAIATVLCRQRSHSKNLSSAAYNIAQMAETSRVDDDDVMHNQLTAVKSHALNAKFNASPATSGTTLNGSNAAIGSRSLDISVTKKSTKTRERDVRMTLIIII